MNIYAHKAKQALEKREFEDLILGKGNYAIRPANLPTAAPTDINTIFEAGIYLIVNEDNRDTIANLLKDAITKLLDEKPADMWMAYNACWAQVYFEQKKKAPFIITNTEFLNLVKNKLYSRKAELEECKEYDGALYANGLWEDIHNSNNVLVQKFGVSIV